MKFVITSVLAFLVCISLSGVPVFAGDAEQDVFEALLGFEIVDEFDKKSGLDFRR